MYRVHSEIGCIMTSFRLGRSISEIIGQSYGIRVQTAISRIASSDDSAAGGKALQLQDEINYLPENPVFIVPLSERVFDRQHSKSSNRQNRPTGLSHFSLLT
jgi:hypothetical protein